MSDDAKTNLLGAALHFNPELKEEVEMWVREIVRAEFYAQMNSGHNFERMHINNFNVFIRLVREVQKHDLERLSRNGL